MDSALCEVGMVGLGVMGRSLALNLADHGHSVCGYDKDGAKGQALCDEGAGKPVAFADSPAAFVQRLRPPRVIVLLVAPAPVVDTVLRDLLPHVAAGQVAGADRRVDRRDGHVQVEGLLRGPLAGPLLARHAEYLVH